MVQKYAEGEAVVGDIFIMMLGMLILQLIFLVMGTAIAALYKNAKKSSSLSTGIVLFTFILSDCDKYEQQARDSEVYHTI